VEHRLKCNTLPCNFHIRFKTVIVYLLASSQLFWPGLPQDPLDPVKTVIVIRSLVPSGVAEQDGRLLPGDRLMYVNTTNLENASLEDAVQALKGANLGTVQIGVAKPLPVSIDHSILYLCAYQLGLLQVLELFWGLFFSMSGIVFDCVYLRLCVKLSPYHMT